MTRAVKAQLVRRSDCDAVFERLARDPLGNLFLIDQAARLGSPPAPGEVRTEIAVARRGDEIVGVVALRPTVVFEKGIGPEAIESFIPLLETLGVGLVKSDAPLVDELWRQIQRRAHRRVVVDRHETAYVLRSDHARLRDSAGQPVSRSAREADLEALVVAARESLREEQRPDPFTGDVRNFRRWVRGRIPRARLVEDAGEVAFVGYADVQRPEGWLLQGVYTFPSVRRRGLARTGVSCLCREAFGAGAEHVQLAVVEGNLAGEGLYEGLGFKPFARLRTILYS